MVSGSGHAAHPDDIIASCRALHEHVKKLQEDADRDLREFEEKIRERDLAEKRRLAPGWLDSDARMLEPERAKVEEPAQEVEAPTEAEDTDEGKALDRAFGGMNIK